MQRFGPYRDLVEIGRGGMSVVYRATAPDGRLIVLKLMAPHLVGNITARRRFELEGRLTLNHPNIARVHRAGLHDGTPFIEMEYVAGETLSARVTRQGPLSPSAAAHILADVADALDYAHCLGVIHRDIKPSNIIIRPEGRAVLTDFGVAKLPDATAYTATTARVGSVLFMSPEQAAGAYTLAPASDIYSLGATIYYTLTGRAPFQGSTDVAIARQHIEQTPPHPSDIQPALPRAVGDVLMRALAKSPSQRPSSAGALARGFQAALKTTERAASVAPDRALPMSTASDLAKRSNATTPARRGSSPLGLLAGLMSVGSLIALTALAFLIPLPSLSGSTGSTPRAIEPFITRQTTLSAQPSPTASFTATPAATLSPMPVFVPRITTQRLSYPTPTRTPRPRPTQPTRQLPDPIPPIVSSATLPVTASTAPPVTPSPTTEPTSTPEPTPSSPTAAPETPPATPEPSIIPPTSSAALPEPPTATP